MSTIDRIMREASLRRRVDLVSRLIGYGIGYFAQWAIFGQVTALDWSLVPRLLVFMACWLLAYWTGEAWISAHLDDPYR